MRNDEKFTAITAAPETAPLDARERAIVTFAEALTRAPASRPEAIDALRSAGFDDRAILDLVHVVAYFNFVNRIAEGLGVELED